MEHKQIELENELEQIFEKLGFATRKYTCFNLKKLIFLVIKKPDALITDEYNGLEYKAVPNKYYDQLARLTNITRMSANMFIRHSIDDCCRYSSQRILSEHFGYPIRNPRSRPTNGDLIFMIATALREKYQILPEEGEFEWPQISEEEKAMLGYDETQEDPIFEDEDFIEVDSDEDFEF
jgi:hypothetical protein